jgi:hypothetical protein
MISSSVATGNFSKKVREPNCHSSVPFRSSLCEENSEKFEKISINTMRYIGTAKFGECSPQLHG